VDNHPYREEQYKDPCALCGELASTRCPGCDRPACGGHGITRWRWCGPCEEGFSRYLTELKEKGDRAIRTSMAWLYLAACLAWGVLCGLAWLMTRLGVDFSTTAIAICVAGPSGMLLAFYVYARLIRHRALRRRYLRRVERDRSKQ